ncbi:MAG: RNA polymerase subunit sigma-54 [Rhodospirillaceae bacterium]|nr:RNA polymerase subunit sigma-54 [Rhodospirillaceae bacterium]
MKFIQERWKSFSGLPAVFRAVIFMALASILFVAMHTIVRDLSGEMHPFQIAFFRASLGLIILSPIIFRNNFSILKTGSVKLHALRGLLNAGAMLCFFYGLSITPLAQVTALSFAVPLFATVLAVILLGEVIRIRRITALIIGFLGTLVIIRPGLIEFGIGPVLIILQALIWSVALMVIKVLTRTDSSITIAIYASIFLSPIVLIAAIPFWQTPTFPQVIVMFVIAALGTLAQTLMNESLRLGETSVVMPIEFTRMVWAALFGFCFFGEVPDLFTWTGAILIFGSTTYISIRETKLKLNSKKDASR